MNPELRRNLWLEFSLHRLIGMPVVLGLVFALFGSLGGNWRERAFTAALWTFVLLAHFWGTRQASAAVTDEVRDRTWDWQRLSALSPWQMTWGKLFGATAFTWYGAALSLLVILTMGPDERVSVMWLAVALVGSAIALHAAAVAGSLQAARKDSRLGHRLGAIVMIPIAFGLLGVFTVPWWQNAQDLITWHGGRWEALRFGAMSALVFAAWAVLGAYREMSRELKVRTLPWALPAFILFVAAYVAGFNPPKGSTTQGVFFLTGLIASLALTYYGLFADLTSLMVARRIATHAAAGNWQRVLEELPQWVPPLVLGIAFAFLVAHTITPEFGDARLRSVGLYPIAIVLFATRDAGLLVFFALSAKARRVEAATLLYLVLLWWIIPGLLTAMGAKSLAAFFLPFGAQMNGWQAAGVALLHAVIVWGLVAWRWHRAQESFRPV
jgi:hypothetical protein